MHVYVEYVPLNIPEDTSSNSLRLYLEYKHRQYVDFNTCIDRDDVDEGTVFKTYNEYQRAVERAAASGCGGGTKSKSGKSSKMSKKPEEGAKRHLRNGEA